MNLTPASSSVQPPRARAALVDVRPLDPHVDGTLRLERRDREGRDFVSAASGLAAAGGSLWAVSDEYGELLRFDGAGSAGRATAGVPRQREKPDLEAITTIPAAGTHPAMVAAFGSGSSELRNRGTVQDVDTAGRPVGPARVFDLRPLYDAFAARLPLGPNIEAVTSHPTADGTELLVFHRGKNVGDRNTIFRLDAAAAVHAVRAGTPLPASAIIGEQVVDLGSLQGVRLGFSDATALPDGRIAFVASAEDGDVTKDTIGDGEIRGSVVGLLDANLAVTALRPLTGPPRKVEGIELASRFDPAAPASRFLLVTDPDDPKRRTERMTVTV